MHFTSRLLALGLAICLTASSVTAGAWPRKQGAGFVSVSVLLGWPQDMATWTSMDPTQDYSTLYLEYGVTDRLTAGVDLGRSMSGGGKTIVFVQWPLRQAGTGARIAAQLGVGTILDNYVIRPGLSVGWGRENGWLSLDGLMESYVETGKNDLKLDMTWGRNLRKDAKLVMQVQTGQPDGGDPYARLAPSLVVPLRGPFKLETGVTWGLTGDSSMGLKIGLWSDF